MVVVTEEFANHGRRLAAHHKHPSLEMLVLPYPLEGRPEEEVRQIATDSYDQLLDAIGAKRP